VHLEGSCCCKSVTFSVESPHPYPFMHCYCSICRKTQGGGGFAINIGALHDTLVIAGEDQIASFSAMYTNHETGEYETSPGRRSFCGKCGSGLWVWDPRWPELVHPFASAIDTPLPVPPERNHIFLSSKPDWVKVPTGPDDPHFVEFPEVGSLAQWHKMHGLKG
jgi:hypothetical protein